MTWRDELPEDLRNDPAITDIPDIATLAKSYKDSQKQIGRLSQDAIRRPGEDAGEEDFKAALNKVQQRWPELMIKPDPLDPEQWGDVLKSLGHPDEPTEYKLKDIDDDVIESQSDFIDNLKTLGHKAKLTKRQFEALAGEMINQNLTARSNASEKIKKQQEALADDWGAAYERNLRVIKSLIAKSNAPEYIMESVTNGDASPDTLRWLYDVAVSLNGEAAELHKQDGGNMELTPMEAQEQIDEMRRNKDHDIHHPERGDAHRRAREKMQELYKIKQGKAYKPDGVYGVSG